MSLTREEEWLLLAYLGVLAGAPPRAGHLDIRWREDGGPMRRRFIATSRPREAARLMLARAPRGDVYVGVAPRARRTRGGRAQIDASHLVWVESDDPATEELLRELPFAPTLEIGSGTPGHLQLYWRLEKDHGPLQVERVNRRLAVALSADPASAEIARVLRPPLTLNHKHDPPAPVRLLALRPHAIHTLDEIAAVLPEDPRPRRASPPVPVGRSRGTRVDRELLAIPAAQYVRVLAGREPNAAGKVLCPFHDETHASLQLYPDGSFYCFGSGCARGGTIYDFAAHLWGIPPRGPGFIELRERLAERFAQRSARAA